MRRNDLFQNSMKKTDDQYRMATTSKLTLRRETMRELTARELHASAGGNMPSATSPFDNEI